MRKVTPFLMFDDRLEEAMAFYTATFPDSEIRSVARDGADGPITSAEFVVGGQVFMGYNGGPSFSFSEGFSLFVDCADQAEVDAYWEKLLQAGATPTACGWIKDPFGLSWQIVPRRFMELIRDENPRPLPAEPPLTTRSDRCSGTAMNFPPTEDPSGWPVAVFVGRGCGQSLPSKPNQERPR